MKQAFIVTLCLVLLVPVGSWAQKLPKPEDVVALRAEPARLRLRPGATATLKLKVEILPGFHINSNRPLEDYLIPTEVFLPASPQTPDGFELAGASYPKAELKTFSFAPGEKLAVHEGRVVVAVRLRAGPGVQAGTHSLALGLRYQACNDQVCLRPAERQLTLTIDVRTPAAR